MIRLITALTLLAASPAAAQTWVVVPEQSRLGFGGTQTGTPFTGAFQRFAAQISFDPAKPEAAKIAVTIDMASARTGDKERDTALPGAEWFDVAKHPTARFEVRQVRATGPNSYTAIANLTMKGRTRPVTLPFTLAINGTTATMKGSLTLDRSQFQVGTGVWATGQWVGLPVTVTVDLTARRAP
jgi:polyisoprenoid-binding protein YceI